MRIQRSKLLRSSVQESIKPHLFFIPKNVEGLTSDSCTAMVWEFFRIHKEKREPKFSLFYDQTDKPGSVVCGNLSMLIVANKLKPSLLYIRRADVKI